MPALSHTSKAGLSAAISVKDATTVTRLLFSFATFVARRADVSALDREHSAEDRSCDRCSGVSIERKITV